MIGKEGEFQTKPCSGCLDTEPVKLAHPVAGGVASATFCAHRLSPSSLFSPPLWLLLRPPRKWEIFPVPLPDLPEYQSHQSRRDITPQNTRGVWAGTAVLVRHLLLDQGSCIIYGPGLGHYVPVGRARKTGKRLQTRTIRQPGPALRAQWVLEFLDSQPSFPGLPPQAGLHLHLLSSSPPPLNLAALTGCMTLKKAFPLSIK